MSTFEMMIWGLIGIYVLVVLAGIIFMTLSNRARCSESDLLVAQADEDDYRAGAGF